MTRILAPAAWATPFLAVCAPAAAQHDHAGHGHHPQPVAAPASPPQGQTAQELETLRKAIERYRDFDVARQEGWTKFGGDEPLMGEHWSPPKKLGWPDYQGSAARLDFARPSNLMYTEIDGRKVLTGVAYVVRLADDEASPEGFFGSADRWHVHDFVRAVEAATEERPVLRWLANRWLDSKYRNRGDNRGRLAMVHAWVGIPNPDGIFADYNRTIPYLKLGLPASLGVGASEDAARGLDLATTGGCGNAVDGKLWIADTSRGQRRTIGRACAAAAREVEDAVAKHRDHPAMLDAAAQAAWRRFDAVWKQQLNERQRARIAAITEHGGDHSGH